MSRCRRKDYHPYIDSYMDGVYDGSILVPNDIVLAMELIENKLDDERVFIDTDKIEKAVDLVERYFKTKLYDWELLIYALIHCYYDDDTVVFNEFWIMMGRGNGKSLFISTLIFYLTSEYHNIQEYNIDIIANSEEQAKTSFTDVYNVLVNTWEKSKHYFKKNLEIIKNIKTNSYIKYHTSNAKTKDGFRSGALVFDELHSYENNSMINVFTSGFGKKRHNRTFKITTNGNVRDGVLDKDLVINKNILNREIKNSRTLPLIYRIESEEEYKDSKMWHKANPSLKYLSILLLTMETEFEKLEYDDETKGEFLTKRMNLPRSNMEIAVADYDKCIKPTNQPLPDLTGWNCTVGIDYAAFNDMASVNFHFKKGDKRFDINHSWLCLYSLDIGRIKQDYNEWARNDLITLVDDKTINPKLLTDYIQELARKYHIKKIALDNNKYALVSEALAKIGFNKDKKNLVLVRPNDIYKTQKVINDCFIRNLFTWGDNPVLRWATNNTKLLLSGKKTGEITDNYYYGKIEPRSRKTDPFMALVHSMAIEDELNTNNINYIMDVIT